MMSLQALEFYRGLHRALKLSDIDASVVRAFDWDQTSRRVYELNYGPSLVQKADISTLSVSDLTETNAPLWLLSPSCQPYTVLNPTAKGARDPRAKSFLHLVEHIIPALTEAGCGPKYILVENVAGFETSSTRQLLVRVLRNCKYATIELLLTPLQFGIPNSRLRYYLLAKLQPNVFANVSREEVGSHSIWRNIPGHGNPWTDNRENCSVTQIKAYLDPDFSDETNHECKIPDRVLAKWGRLFDIVLPTSKRSCCFTRGYTQLVERAGSILQMNEELDTTVVFDEFLALQKQELELSSANPQAQSSIDLPLSKLTPLRLRYFSPSELLRLFHFSPPIQGSLDDVEDGETKLRSFIWPSDVSAKSKYRLLGNSVNVEVVRRLINYLFEGEEHVV